MSNFQVLGAFTLGAMISPRVGPIYSSVGVVYILYCVYNIASLAR